MECHNIDRIFSKAPCLTTKRGASIEDAYFASNGVRDWMKGKGTKGTETEFMPFHTSSPYIHGGYPLKTAHGGIPYIRTTHWSCLIILIVLKQYRRDAAT
jgi:hypothetical protein